ncbi:MAG: glycosyltransferase family 4 protein [bacterium]|nr:glycosyltransferase family 4 protein [bacterium]
MRIAYDLRPLQSATAAPRGIGTYTRELAKALASLGAELVYLKWKDLPFVLDESWMAGSKVIELPLHLRKMPFRYMNFLWERYLSARVFRNIAKTADIAHFPTTDITMSFPASDIGIPKVLTVHDMMSYYQPEVVFSGLKGIKFKVIMQAFRSSWTDIEHADHVAADSDFTKESVEKYLQSRQQKFNNKITSVLLGYSDTFKPASAGEKQRIKEKYGLPEKFIFYLGGLAHNKNLDRLFAVAEKLCDELPVLAVAGPANNAYSQHLRQSYPKANVKWLGFADSSDLPALYSAASAFVFPSYMEGFGLPVLEAMACGTPVACANVSSVPEVCGDCAVQFDPYNIDEIAQALRKLAGDDELCRQLSTKGLERARLMTWEHTAKNMLELYSSVISQYKKRK